MSDPAFQRAQQHYARVREVAYERARDAALASGVIHVPLRLAQCDAHTLAVWRTSWTGSHFSGFGGWDWESLLRRAWKRPSAFHVAIWSGGNLCGLATGRVSDPGRNGSRTTISIHYIESCDKPDHPLRGKIAFLAAFAAEAYGRALGAEWIRLMDPLPGAISVYLDLGFAIVEAKGRVLYCERRIKP